MCFSDFRPHIFVLWLSLLWHLIVSLSLSLSFPIFLSLVVCLCEPLFTYTHTLFIRGLLSSSTCSIGLCHSWVPTYETVTTEKFIKLLILSIYGCNKTFIHLMLFDSLSINNAHYNCQQNANCQLSLLMCLCLYSIVYIRAVNFGPVC